ncbi:MAG TPA: hypothetical protein PKL85_11295 [Bacteroidia bacterium]|mgnify:CR=1 FL=1|nr:hypothetical protein [Bacteroidia bacterium]
MKTTQTKADKKHTAKKLSKAEAKAITGGRNIAGKINKSKLQSSTGIS